MLLVYFVLAGQYESWILPLAVLLAVPLALLGTVGALSVVGVANNLYTQIGRITACITDAYGNGRHTLSAAVLDADVGCRQVGNTCSATL